MSEGKPSPVGRKHCTMSSNGGYAREPASGGLRETSLRARRPPKLKSHPRLLPAVTGQLSLSATISAAEGPHASPWIRPRWRHSVTCVIMVLSRGA